VNQQLQSPPIGDPFRETRVYLIFGVIVIALLFGGIGVWAAGIEISGAVLAKGTLVVDSSVKKVQHPTGGVIGEILVKDGSHVKAGDVVVRLDETVTRANLKMILKLLDETAVRQARLIAERDDRSEIAFSEDLRKRLTDSTLAEIMVSEKTLFDSRRSAREGQKSQLRERIEQLREEIDGLKGQLISRKKEADYATQELAGLIELDRKALVSMQRITAARRTVAQLEGDIAQVVASIAQAKGKITETGLQILQLDQDTKAEVSKDLRDQQAKEAELTERRVAAEDQLRRTDIRSPQNGIVHQLLVHTVGGVIAPSETIMLIVPEADRLVIDARIPPQDIDQVNVGQTAFIRFSAFNHRTTPEVAASVVRVSPDLVTESRSGTGGEGTIEYYAVRLTLTHEAKEKLDGLALIPGMPVEVHIKTAERTALSYFMKPLADQFAMAFKER